MRYVDMEKKGLCNRGSSTSYEEAVDTAPTNTPCTVADEECNQLQNVHSFGFLCHLCL